MRNYHWTEINGVPFEPFIRDFLRWVYPMFLDMHLAYDKLCMRWLVSGQKPLGQNPLGQNPLGQKPTRTLAHRGRAKAHRF